jgi:sugar lactone lactonase YvrE
MATAFSTLISGYSFLESPRWRGGRLWLSDFYTHQVIATDMQGRVEKIADVPQQPSGLGWLPDGRLLVVSMRDRKLMRLEADGTLAVHADLSGVAGGHCNDMVVDRHGNAYVGNFGFDLMGGAPFTGARLARVAPDGQVSAAAEGLYFPNAAMITADGGTLIVAETMGNRLSAFTIAQDGSLGPRRDWATFAPLPEGQDLAAVMGQLKVAPDGAALDAEGAVWAADAVGHRVLRVAEGGQILQEISTGEMGVYACGLGGPDGKTLFLCVAPDFAEHARQAAREAAIWTTRVDVPGAAH